MTLGITPLWGGALGSGQAAVKDPTHGGFEVPDGLGGTRRNYVLASALTSTLSMGTLGGLGTKVARVAGALTFANADLARMELAVWWAYSGSVGLTRVHPDGERVPVRGAAPKATGGLTRRNDSQNPSCSGVDPLAGYNPLGDTAAPTLITDGPLPKGVAGAARFTASATNSVSTTLPVLLTGAERADGIAIRVSHLADQLYPSPRLYPSPALYPSLLVGARRVVSWYDSGGVWLGDVVLPIEPADLTRAVGADFVRISTVLEPPTGADHGVIALTVNGLGQGATVDLTAHLSELGTVVRPFFDGSSRGANWLGEVGRSPSVLSTPVSVYDGECPFDIPVRYEITNPTVPGVRILTDPVQLDSRGITWMTDPLSPDAPIRVTVTSEPKRTRAMEVVTFAVPGRKRLVAQSEEVRHDPTGTIQFGTKAQAEHGQLRKLLESPLAKLIRTPGNYWEWDPNTWIVLGTDDDESPSQRATGRLRTITVPFTQVDRPTIARSAA